MKFHRQSVLASTVLAFVLLPLGALVSATGSYSAPLQAKIIDAKGRRILSIFYLLPAEATFANQLILAGRKSKTLESGPVVRSVGFMDGKLRECRLRNAAYHPQIGSRSVDCNGYYMLPQTYDCPQSCDENGTWQEYYNTGTQEHRGYYYPLSASICHDCVLPEAGCYAP